MATRSVAIAATLLLLVLAFLLFFNWNWLKGPIQRAVGAATGRELRIDGDLGVRWNFFRPTIFAEGLHFSNAAWSQDREMANIKRLEVQMRILPLLSGHLVIPYLQAQEPRVIIERDATGRGNWEFDKDKKDDDKDDDASKVELRDVLISAGHLQFREPTLQTALQLQIDSVAPAQAGGPSPLTLKGDGTYRGAPFSLAGKVDSPLELQGKPQPYRIDLTARAGATEAQVAGRLLQPLQFEDVQVDFRIKGADLEDLYRLVGVSLPKTPPYELRGKLGRKGQTISYHDFTGRVGDSDLSGDADIVLGRERPLLKAKLKSKLLDFDDLAGFIGGTPSVGEGETASAEQAQEKAAQKASGRVLPSQPFHLEKLRAMDADVTLEATRIDAPKLPLETMSAHLTLDNGLLKLDPLDFKAAGGVLKTRVSLDARKEQIGTNIELDVRQLELPKLMPNVKSLQDSFGSISGVVQLKGQGNSVAEMLGASNGNLSLIMGSGRMSNLLLELAGLDVAEALKFLLGKDRTVALRCAYADFSVEDGRATVRSFAIDTTDTALLARGSFNFMDESLDLTLLPRPKDFSPITLRSPLRVRGHFADPSFGPSPGPLLLRGAAVAALAAIAPPAALIGLIETGPGKDTDCGRKSGAAQVTPPAAEPARSAGPHAPTAKGPKDQISPDSPSPR